MTTSEPDPIKTQELRQKLTDFTVEPEQPLFPNPIVPKQPKPLPVFVNTNFCDEIRAELSIDIYTDGD